MARYRIKDEESGVSIQLTDVGGHEAQVLEAFAECQAGRCSCPTNEYEKLAGMEVDQGQDTIRVRLETKPGEKFDTAEIAACLDDTTAKLADQR